YFDLSTNSPTLVRELNRRFAEKHLYMLDAPVSGGPRGAASGRLALWVGGDEQIFNRHKPVLDAIGDQARYIGPIGAGSVAQLGREMKVPMHMANLALDELTAALNRGWENRDSRVAMLLQQERAGIKIAVPEADVKAALDRDGKG